jgi:hypothetical protein
VSRCGCANACSCVIEAGEGVDVSGVGSKNNPYVITADTGDIGGLFSVTDTTSVNMTLGGQGTSNEPYTLKSDATLRMQDLSNVQSGATPSAGHVPVYNGSEFIFQTPPTTPPGSVSVTTPLKGDGSGVAPLRLPLDPLGLINDNPNGIGLTTQARANVFPTFASASARDSALPSPMQGMECWRSDLKCREVYKDIGGKLAWWSEPYVGTWEGRRTQTDGVAAATWGWGAAFVINAPRPGRYFITGYAVISYGNGAWIRIVRDGNEVVAHGCGGSGWTTWPIQCMADIGKDISTVTFGLMFGFGSGEVYAHRSTYISGIYLGPV